MDPTPTPPADAEDVFAEFLERVEAGETADFEALCREHAALAPALRRIHVRWQAMTRAFTELSQSGIAEAAAEAAPSPTIDALMARLQASGPRIARYAIGPELARGAMGRVMQAWDEELRREVALKVHRGPGDARRRRRFLEEAQIAAQLDHPGIVPIHELGVDGDGRPFFSMRLVRGRELGEVIELSKQGTDGWSRTRVLNVLLRVCEAMAFAHDKGVVHRDLKPANVMVGRFGEIYVMDWGLAHVRTTDGGGTESDASEHTPHADDVDTLRREIADEDDVSPLLTRHGDVIGTPAYMAPEQAHGLPGATAPAVDVYATGAMLYHLLAGRMPYAEVAPRKSDDVLQAVRSGPPARLPDDVPPELRAICERAMAREPADRYADIAALGDDLRAFLEVRTVAAYATGGFAELQKWIARNRTLAAACVALVLVLAGGGAAVTALWVQADRALASAAASATSLLTEVDRSAFRAARLALQVDNSSDAADNLWRAHLSGRMSRATDWALLELFEHDPYLVTVPEHDDVVPVAFAPVHRAVLVGSPGGRVQVRDEDTLAMRAELGDGTDPISALDVLRGGDVAVAGTQSGDVLQFRVATGELLRKSRPHTGPVRVIAAVGAGGAAGFASGGADGRVLHWRTPDAEPALVLTHEHGITALVAHPNGSGVAAGDINGFVSGKAFDESWHLSLNLQTRLTALAFDRPGHELWIGATDHLLRVQGLVKGKQSRTVPTRNGTCRQLALDDDGSFLLGGWWRIDRISPDGATQTTVARRGISRFAFDPKSRRLMTSGLDSGLGLVDVGTKGRRPVRGGRITLSGDGSRVATIIAGEAIVRDVDRDEVVGRVQCGAGWPELDDDGATLAVPSNGRIHVYDVATGERRITIQAPGDAQLGDGCAFSPDGSQILVRTADDTRVLRLDARDGRVLADQRFPDTRLIRTVWSADGNWLATIARGEPVVRVCDVRANVWRDVPVPVETYHGGPATLAAVALSADGGRIAVGTWQGMVVVRDRDGTCRTIAAHGGTIWGLEFAARDDNLLFTTGGSQGIAAWDLEANECCYQTLQNEVVGLMQLSRDGRTMACQPANGALLIDFDYRRRHVAGNLAYHLQRLAGKVELPPGREAALRAWAADELARPWPRWK